MATEELPFDIMHPCTDYGFKHVAKSSVVICGFINTVFNIQPPITQVDCINTELGSSCQHGANIIVDLLCRTADNELILLEMQNQYRDDYTSKIFLEFCRLVANFDAKAPEILAKKRTRSVAALESANNEGSNIDEAKDEKKAKSSSEFWKRIRRVVVGVITNHTINNPAITQPINEFTMLNTAMPHLPMMPDLDARIVIIALSTFNKTEATLATPLDRWLYAFKDTNLGKGRIPSTKHIEHLSAVAGAGSDAVPGLVEFYRQLNVQNINPDVIRQHNDAIEEYNSALDEAELRGEVKGGRSAKLEVVRTMFIQMPDASDAIISNVTAVPLQIIASIRAGKDNDALLQAWDELSDV
eukprot:gene21631-24529_t